MEFQFSKEAVNRSLSSPPALNLFTTYDFKNKFKWMEENWTVSFYVVAGYLAFIYGGKKFMKNRKPLDLTNALIVWNFALAIFSLAGSYVFVGEFIHMTWLDSICGPWNSRTEESLYWGWLFCASKFVELIDTVFLVLRKKPIIFLHWYHHVSVLLYCWTTYTEQNSTATWFALMNYVVHSFMYTYYGLRAMKIHVPSKVAMAITSMQLIQMIGGLISIGSIFAILNFMAGSMATVPAALLIYFNNEGVKSQGLECATTTSSLYLALGMYASYFILFGNFFYKAYFAGKSKKGIAKASQ